MEHQDISRICWLGAISCLGMLSQPALSQESVERFYRGKTVTISVGFSAGGGYDLHARTIGRVIGKYLPGSPSVVVKNVPGASGLVLMNALYNTAPRDGTEIGVVDRATALEPLLNARMARFEALKMNWIGSSDNETSTCFSWHSVPIKSVDDLMKKELVVGSSGSIGEATTFPRILNATLGTKFKVIPGYAGSSEAFLAMERGETTGYCAMSIETMMVLRPEWVRERRVNFLVQMGLEKSRNLPDVPLALDLAKTPRHKQMLELIVSPSLLARPFVAPPGIPEDRVAALRAAFNLAMSDHDYVDDANKRNMHVELVKAEKIQEVIQRVYAMPQETVAAVVEAIK